MKRFFDKIEKCPDTGCWNWTGALRSKKRESYGALKYLGRTVDAHKVSWMIHNGEIPDGMYICHVCDNKKCVNPKHLFLGTHSDNMKDAMRKGRLNPPDLSPYYIKKGNIPSNRLLTNEQVVYLKELIRNRGNKSLKQIANITGIPHYTVRDISCGRRYCPPPATTGYEPPA